jgi:hypothetical protein
VGVRWQYHLSKAYGIGLGLEYGYSSYHFNRTDITPNDLEATIGMGGTLAATDKISQREVYTDQLSIELFQRVRLVPGGSISHKGLHWDLGGWFTWAFHNEYRLGYTLPNDNIASSRYEQLNNISPLDGHRWLYGVTTRLTYDWLGIYGRYRLNGIGQTAPAGQITLPRLEVGLQIMF